MNTVASETDSWLTVDDFGVVDRLSDQESIVTSFYKAVLPLWPESSSYVIREKDGSERRIAIPLQTRSVVLGYLRAPLWFVALALLFPAIADPTRFIALLYAGVMIAGCASLLTFVAGRLSEVELTRRQLLRRVVGFGAPPELLTEDMRSEVCATLTTRWNTKSNRRWHDAIEDGDASEILIALAEYHLDGPMVAQAHENFDNKLWN